MAHTIQINDKKQIKISKGNLDIVIIEHIFKGSVKFNVLVSGMTFESVISEMEQCQNIHQFATTHDLAVFQGKA